MRKITIYNRIMVLLSIALILIVSSGTCSAAEIIVHNGESIQVAVDNATSGDTIIVEPGTYNGDITLNKNDLVITSQSGNPDDTIIKGNGFYLASDGQGIVIKGFTLKGTDTSYGISLEEYADCTIENNKILNYNTAIDTNIYSSFTIKNNEISNCESGVSIGECFNAIVKNNIISNCETGVIVGDLGNAQIENNIITKNDNGIALMYEGHATIVGNAISFSKKCGLYDNAYHGSTIYNNYFNNTVNVIFSDSQDSPNTWNTTKTTGINIISGPYIAGNYWAKPDGTGFSQTHYDVNGDGIAEEAVIFKENEIDHVPLVSSSTVTPGWPAETPDETENETQNGTQIGILNEIQNGIQIGILNETQNGNQIETLNETENETQAETSTEETEDTESSSSGGSHHSSGSSGGSTGGSPEPQKNVASKDTTKIFISGGKPVYFNFTNNVTVVDYISFESKKTVGKTTAIVENLKDKSDLVTELPNGTVYRSFNVWVGNGDYGDSDNILNAVIGFKVEKVWTQEKGIDPLSIVLYKYDDEKKEWAKLPVNLKTEDDQSLHFTANVPGYSSFVITGDKGESSKLTTETTQTVINSNESDNASKAAVEKPKSPGFGIIIGIVCLICAVKRKKE